MSEHFFCNTELSFLEIPLYFTYLGILSKAEWYLQFNIVKYDESTQHCIVHTHRLVVWGFTGSDLLGCSAQALQCCVISASEWLIPLLLSWWRETQNQPSINPSLMYTSRIDLCRDLSCPIHRHSSFDSF